MTYQHLHTYKPIKGTNLSACTQRGCQVAKPTPKKLSKPPIGTKKKKLWTIFSIFSRRKDASPDGIVSCVTCGVVKFWNQGDAGHFLPGRNNSILFYEKGVHFQCKQCNGHFRIGTTVPDIDKIYEEYIGNRYGKKEVEYQRKLKRETKQFDEKELDKLIIRYEGYVNEIELAWIQGKKWVKN